MTQNEMIKAFRALGCRVTPRCCDGVIDDQVVTTYSVLVSVEDMGSMVVRHVREGEAVAPGELVAEMRKELKGRVKETRAAIRAERSRS